MHADPTVRAIASEVLRRFIRAFPSRRNEVLVGMAAFAAKIPDEFPEVNKLRVKSLHPLSCSRNPSLMSSYIYFSWLASIFTSESLNIKHLGCEHIMSFARGFKGEVRAFVSGLSKSRFILSERAFVTFSSQHSLVQGLYK